MTGASEVGWLVISLKRTPARLQEFERINGQLGLPIEVLEAVDGQQLDLGELERSGLIVPDLRWGRRVVGAALSHRAAWLRAVEQGRPIVICEDDVYLRHDVGRRVVEVLDKLPSDWDVVHFGLNTDSVMDLEIFPGCHARGHFSLQHPRPEDCVRFVASGGSVAPVRLHNAFGVCCYAVSPAGAQRLIEGCFPLSRTDIFVKAASAWMPTVGGDVVMNRLYATIGAYLCMPPLAMVTNDKSTSTIWQP